MNKHELIKKYETKGEQLKEFPVVAIGDVLKNLRELDEPEKVTIPQFVGDWIKHCRGLGYSLYQSMTLVHENAEIKKWFIFVDNQDLFARAWLDGYEVEKEPKYTVMVKGVSGYGRYLNKALLSKEYFFASENEVSGYRTKHTRKELEEAGFGWVFDCEGIEIEEVE